MTTTPSSKPVNDTAASETIAMCEKLVTKLWLVERLSDWIVATDIQGAGKRGKRCIRFGLGECYPVATNSPAFETAVRAVVQLACRDASVEEMRVGLRWIESTTQLAFSEHAYRGVDIVSPTNIVKVEGPKVEIEASPTEFVVRCKLDTNNRPTLMSKGRKDSFRMVEWVKANAGRIQDGMSFHEVWTALREAGTTPHYYCAMD